MGTPPSTGKVRRVGFEQLQPPLREQSLQLLKQMGFTGCTPVQVCVLC